MVFSKIALIAAVVLIPLFYLLYYFGFAVTRANFALFRADYSVPTRWEGTYSDTSGFMRRNFVVFKKFSVLSIEIATTSGTLDVVVKGPDGSTLSPASGIYGQDTSIRFDVSQHKRCSVALRMDSFCGQFRIALQ